MRAPRPPSLVSASFSTRPTRSTASPRGPRLGALSALMLGLALGAKPETLAGLSGLGDLILTCNSPKSRNMSLGLALGEGKTLEEVMGARNSVSEGVHSATAVVALARKYDIEMPIAAAVAAIVTGKAKVDEAIATLLARPFRSEG